MSEEKSLLKGYKKVQLGDKMPLNSALKLEDSVIKATNDYKKLTGDLLGTSNISESNISRVDESIEKIEPKIKGSIKTIRIGKKIKECYGFITREDGGKDVFFDITSLSSYNPKVLDFTSLIEEFSKISVNSKFTFDTKEGKNGLVASNMVPYDSNEIKVSQDTNIGTQARVSETSKAVGDVISSEEKVLLLSEEEALEKLDKLEQDLSLALEIYNSKGVQDFSYIKSTKMDIEYQSHEEKYLTEDLIEIYALFGGYAIPEENLYIYNQILKLLKVDYVNNPEIQAKILKIIALFFTYIISIKRGKDLNLFKIKALKENDFHRELFYDIYVSILNKYRPEYIFNEETWTDELNNISREDLLKETAYYMFEFIQKNLNNLNNIDFETLTSS